MRRLAWRGGDISASDGCQAAAFLDERARRLFAAISGATTDTGLKVCCEIDGNLYLKGVELSD